MEAQRNHKISQTNKPNFEFKIKLWLSFLAEILNNTKKQDQPFHNLKLKLPFRNLFSYMLDKIMVDEIKLILIKIFIQKVF